MNACCCRAFALPAFRDAEDFFDEVRRVHVPRALIGAEDALDAVKTGQLLVPLPVDWEDWPEDAKAAIPKRKWGNESCLYS